MRSLSLLVAALGCAGRLLAVSYVVPNDRFEIDRSSAIIAGRVLRSHTERSPRFGIETITDVLVEEAIKGNAGKVIQIHEPGGVLDDDAVLIPGVPGFEEGERVLLFLYQRENGDYTVSDLHLGSFHFARDAGSEELLIRNEAELVGWDPDGTAHRERHRAAEPFIRYILSVVRGDAAAEDYFVAIPPPAGAMAEALQPAGFAAAFTATSYTVNLFGGLGARWNVFPSNVNFNQGNSETGVLGSGTAQINVAFSSWNSGGAHYVLASMNPNPKGIMDAADSVNNIVFEKDLTAAGAQPYSCSQGGVLGMGGMHSVSFGGGTHQFHGETFGTTKEVDVSMNQGLGLCSAAQFPSSAFNTTVTHEVGHTLGFRHSDQNRTQNAICSSDPSLDCSNSAIMEHLLIAGLNGQLQPWDSRAVDSVYGNAACTSPAITQQPAGLTITNGNSATLAVAATGTLPLTYQWFIGQSGNTLTPVGGGNTPVVFVKPAVTTSYWVRVSGPCLPDADSSAATVTVVPAPCTAPQIVNQPQGQTAAAGSSVSLSIGFTGTSPTVTWFQGAKGDSSTPVGSGPAIASPILTQTTQFWARIANACGSVDSNAATILVTAKLARRRAVRH